MQYKTHLTHKTVLLIITLISVAPISSMAQAAIIAEATSELEYRHSYLINNGSVPQGIRLSSVPQSLSIAGGAQSTVDEGSAINEEGFEVQVGNPFLTPPLPYEARRNNRTTLNAGAEGAQSDYDISALSVYDQDTLPIVASTIQRDIENSGAAEVVLSSQAVAAEAESFYNITRGYRLENISNQRQRFSIVGDVSFDLFSQYEGMGGFADTAMSLFTLFENVMGVNATLDLTSFYDPNIVESNANASVFERLTTNEPNLGGFLLSTSALAEGGGDVSTASISESFSYRLLIEMDVGSSFEFFTGFSQRNTAIFDPQSINVSSPTALILFGFSALILLFRGCRRS